MHYGDDEHIANAKIVLVIYKHVNLQDGGYDLNICSIYECKHMDLFTLKELWDTFEVTFKKEIKKIKPEKLYKVVLMLKKNGKKTKLYWFMETEIDDIMLYNDKLLGLH